MGIEPLDTLEVLSKTRLLTSRENGVTFVNTLRCGAWLVRRSMGRLVTTTSDR